MTILKLEVGGRRLVIPPVDVWCNGSPATPGSAGRTLQGRPLSALRRDGNCSESASVCPGSRRDRPKHFDAGRLVGQAGAANLCLVT